MTKGGLVLIAGGDSALRAFDKQTGAEIWAHELPARAISTPMTYRLPGGDHFVVIAAGSGAGAALFAFAQAGT